MSVSPKSRGAFGRDNEATRGYAADGTPAFDPGLTSSRIVRLLSHVGASKVAATAVLTATEMLEDHPLLRIDSEATLSLLMPNSGTYFPLARAMPSMIN